MIHFKTYFKTAKCQMSSVGDIFRAKVSQNIGFMVILRHDDRLTTDYTATRVVTLVKPRQVTLRRSDSGIKKDQQFCYLLRICHAGVTLPLVTYQAFPKLYELLLQSNKFLFVCRYIELRILYRIQV